MAEITTYGKEIRDNHPDKYKKLVEAMNKSNGKVNNVVGMFLAMSDTTTVDDVVNMASGYGTKSEELKGLQNIIGYSYDNQPWKVTSGRTKDEILRHRKTVRQDKFNKGFEYKFEDTFLYRTMVKLGLSTKLEAEKNYWGRSTYSVNSSYHNKLSDSNYVQPVMLFYHASENLREIILNDMNLNEMWTEQAKIQRTVSKPWSEKEKLQHPVTSTDEEWRQFQTKHIIKEFDQVAHMPMELKKKMNDWIEYYKTAEEGRYYGTEKLPPMIMHTILSGFRYPCEDKTVELVREAYEVMDYMGIGVVWNFVETETIESNPDGSIKYDENGKTIPKYVYRRAYYKDIPYKVGAMMKHISSSMRKFAADVKKGFDVRDVREIVIEDLNGWSTAQARDHWTFFERDDAPTDYPDLQKKKKGNKVKKENIELNDIELMVVKKFKESKQSEKENENDTKSES